MDYTIRPGREHELYIHMLNVSTPSAMWCTGEPPQRADHNNQVNVMGILEAKVDLDLGARRALAEDSQSGAYACAAYARD
jgi:hypothetical protein